MPIRGTSSINSPVIGSKATGIFQTQDIRGECQLFVPLKHLAEIATQGGLCELNDVRSYSYLCLSFQNWFKVKLTRRLWSGGDRKGKDVFVS